MIITCHGCEAQYAIPDEKVRHRNVRVRCRECSTVIRVERLDGAASSAPPAASVRAAAFPSPFDDAPSSVPPPASSGGVITTASEQSDRITSPVQVRAQVARRENDARAKRDLFSREEVAEREAVPKAREVIPPPAPLGLSTGARNETSVLFSLATLTVGKSSSPPPPPVEMRTKEDSGLIDLNQLMASRVETSFRFVPPPLPSDPPLGAYTSEVETRSPSISDAALPNFGGARRRSRKVLAIGGAVALAAILGIVAFASSGSKPEPQADVGSGPVMSTTAAIAAAAAAQPPPAPVALTTPAPINAKPIVAGAGAGGNAAGASDAYAGPPNHRHRHGHHGGGGAAHAGGGAKAAAASAPAKPPPASDPCGCHGNLMCAMKCSS